MNIFYVKNLSGLAEITKNGNIYLNEKVKNLPKITRNFIIEHEKAHYLLKTDNEFIADFYSLQKNKFTEYKSLKKIVESVLNTLPFDRQEHFERLNNLIFNVAKIDYIENKNKKALNLMRTNRDIFDFPEIKSEIQEYSDIYKPEYKPEYKSENYRIMDDSYFRKLQRRMLEIEEGKKESKFEITTNHIVLIGIVLVFIYLIFFKSK